MGKTKVIELSAEQRGALEHGYRKGKSHAFRVRCQMILLKSECRSSLEVGHVLGCCEIVVNNWLSRYEAEGIKGLETRPGRGRKPKLELVMAGNARHVHIEKYCRGIILL
jgi:transposase